MSNRNEDRLSAPVEPVSFANRVEFQELTEFIELPSRGEFYYDGHPLCGQTNIELRWPTTRHKDILNNRSNIREGVAVERFLGALIIDPRIRVESLLMGDRLALMIAARIMLHSEQYDLKFNCPVCFEANESSVNLSEFEETFPEEELLKELNVREEKSTKYGKTYFVKTPKSGVTVQFRLMTGEDQNYLLELEKMRKKKKLNYEMISEQLRRVVLSIDGAADPDYINQFIAYAPSQDTDKVIETYRKVEPNIPLNIDFECEVCGNFEVLEVPLDHRFFWPKR